MGDPDLEDPAFEKVMYEPAAVLNSGLVAANNVDPGSYGDAGSGVGYAPYMLTLQAWGVQNTSAKSRGSTEV